ncbi:RNA polymerase sigma factor [Lentisphaera marina]|uniref:RNA polymerase sigma factor n=1 Tax=Lentisphaera marina TaxID=1111041 RepID=UPI0023650113|nr:RNA polymerase sigma factor [Lentisphaera marina]MDD7985328.1 RNA polymerase sigma factor [Lentisphaera marina]
MNQAKNTRQTLLLKIRDQYNDDAWEEFIAFYRPYVYRVVQNLQQIQPVDREDIIQEVMLIAWKKLPDFEYQTQKGRFRSWLSVITQRTANTFYHKSKKASVFESDFEAQELQKGLPPEIEQICQQEWEKHVTETAWENISAKFEEKVLQSFQKLASGEKGEEVARELGLSQNSVYVYKKRVMAALQKEIAYLDEELR